MRLIASFLLLALAQTASQSYPPPYPRAGTTGLIDTDRVAVWDVPGPQARSPKHRHPMDTIVVFTSWKSGRAIFIPAGTVRAAEEVAAGTKATVFELKQIQRMQRV